MRIFTQDLVQREEYIDIYLRPHQLAYLRETTYPTIQNLISNFY